MHHRIPSIAWASDLHLDHLAADARDRLGQELGRLDGVPLIVTGDISVAPRLVADLEFLADATSSPTQSTMYSAITITTVLPSLRCATR